MVIINTALNSGCPRRVWGSITEAPWDPLPQGKQRRLLLQAGSWGSPRKRWRGEDAPTQPALSTSPAAMLMELDWVIEFHFTDGEFEARARVNDLSKATQQDLSSISIRPGSWFPKLQDRLWCLPRLGKPSPETSPSPGTWNTTFCEPFERVRHWPPGSKEGPMDLVTASSVLSGL